MASIIILLFLLAPTISNSKFIKPGHNKGDHLWLQNSYMKDIQKVVQVLNATDCWICMHTPGQAGEGIPLHSIPLNETGWNNWHTNKPLYFHSVPGSTDHTLFKVQVQSRGTAEICFSRPSSNNSPFLGNNTNCNRIIPLPESCMKCAKGRNETLKQCKNTTTLGGEDSPCCVNKTVTADYSQVITQGGYVGCIWFHMMRKWENNTGIPGISLLPMPSHIWLLCGKMAYRQWPKNWSGTCTLGWVIPTIYKIDSLPQIRLRNKRDTDSLSSGLTLNGNVGTQIARGILPALGVAMNYRDLHILNNWTVSMFNQTIRSLEMINAELSEVREVALQNRYALDIILASQGGVCALIHSHCCVYIHDYEINITHTISYMEDMIKNNPLKTDGLDALDIWGALWSWLPDGSWLRSLIPTIITIIILLIMLCCCIQCLPSLLQTGKGFLFSQGKDMLIAEKQSLLSLADTPVEKTQTEEMWE